MPDVNNMNFDINKMSFYADFRMIKPKNHSFNSRQLQQRVEKDPLKVPTAQPRTSLESSTQAS